MTIATFNLVAIDCQDPAALCEFYRGLVGGEIVPESQADDWIRLRTPSGCDLGFQKVPDYRAPGWPDGDPPQQIHLDFDVPDLDEGEQRVLALGATKTTTQPEPDQWRVFLDPAGHPFCLILV